MAITKDYKAKISPKNQAFAQKIRTLAKEYKIIGMLDVEGLPAAQFQKIRASLKGNKSEILIVKKNIVELTLKEIETTHKGVSKLLETMTGIVGLIFTNNNPFTLYKTVKKSKSAAPAKAGQIAPTDIVVPAGPTPFAPGPIIGELGALKIKAGINAGKVEIKEDAIVAKEGDTITMELAGVLSRLSIEPMEVGLNIKSIFENGTIYTRSVLDVDEDAILADLKAQVSDSFKLAIGLNYVTKDNVGHFIAESARDSLGLGVGIAYPAAETIKQLVSKASAQMSGVANNLPEDIRPAGIVSASATPVASNNTDANEEPKKETPKKEPAVDAAAGLGGLF